MLFRSPVPWRNLAAYGVMIGAGQFGLLFIAMHGTPRRLRVNGIATVSRVDPLMATTVGAQLIVRVAVKMIFPNCPRYVPQMQLEAPSPYLPQAGQAPLEPAWKSFEAFADVVHPRQKTA